MKKIRLGSKGFSLLELLIGITMLAIIVVPVLHAFLTSSKTSGKAKEVRNQTIAAQNILESYEATDIGTIIGDVKHHIMPFGTIAGSAQVFIQTGIGHYSEITSGSTEAADGPVYKVHLRNVTADYKAYDAVLTIDASKYIGRNSVGIVDYKPMDGVVAQPGPGDDANPDVAAARDFASQAQIDSGTEVDYTYFLNRLTRKITITLEKIGGETGIVYCTPVFTYAAHYSYTLTDDSTTPPTVTAHERDYEFSITDTVRSWNYTQAESGTSGLYVFFYPNNPVVLYPEVPGDTIDIINRDNIDLSVYLVRQTGAGADPVIYLREKNDPTTTPPHAQLYYNSATHSYRYYIGYPGDDGFSDYWYNTYPFDGSLIGTPAQNRLYGVTVELYEAGSIQGDGSISGVPLASFDASSLE